jgi:2-polyprenyl-3-methyl-5-hydroxy-6-metoxy-1,4-benzoquinol methylase
MTVVEPRPALAYRCCRKCGHCEQLLAAQEGAGAFEDAEKKYYGESSLLLASLPYPLESEVIANRIATLKRYLHAVETVLEVGPGSGHILKWLLSDGHQVTAVEYAPALARQLSELHSTPILCGEFEKLTFEPESVDVFCSFHVIEHVLDPLAHLRKAYEVVRSGGRAFIATPNARSLQQILFPSLSPNFDSAHTVLFSPQSLRIYCERAGWAVVEEQTPEYTASWLRVATKVLRKLMRQDEEWTAGQYATLASACLNLVMRILAVVSAPFRYLQARAGFGNEIFFVLEKKG